MSIPDNIRAAMNSMQQSELAYQLGISQTYLSDILQGRRSISVFVALQLERVLKLDARELLIAQVDEELKKAKGAE